MRNHQAVWRTAVLAAAAFPASIALGQYTGTSHPDEVPVTTNDAGIKQPMVYLSPSPSTQPVAILPTPELRPRQSVAAPANWAGGQGTAAQPMNELSSIQSTTIQGTQYQSTQYQATQLPAAQTSNVDANIVTEVDGPANRLPVGTLIKTRLLDHLSTRVTPEGTEWRAELTEPAMRDGRVLLPAGAMIHGKVTEIHGGKRVSGEALIHLQPLSVTLPDGMSMGIHAQVIDTNLFRSTKVDDEGTIVRRGNHKEQAGILALTAGSGAAAGALVAGVPGALVGAGIGGGVSGVLWLKQDRQTELPRETELVFELTRPLAVGVQ